MYTNHVPQNHKNGPESGPGGSVWAETLSKRRPEAQDHFPSPPGRKNPSEKSKNLENIQNPQFYRPKQSISAAIPIFATRSSEIGRSRIR